MKNCKNGNSEKFTKLTYVQQKQLVKSETPNNQIGLVILFIKRPRRWFRVYPVQK